MQGYKGLGVDVLEQIRIQAKRRKVDYRVAKSVNDGIGAVINGKADIACGVAFTWDRSTQVTYRILDAIDLCSARPGRAADAATGQCGLQLPASGGGR